MMNFSWIAIGITFIALSGISLKKRDWLFPLFLFFFIYHSCPK